MLRLAFMFLLLTYSGSVGAVGSPLDFSIHQEYTSTRALGMGNAFTAVVDDHSALFYNPAMLALRKDGNLRMFLRAGISPNYIDLNDEIEKAKKSDDEVAAMIEVIEKHYGDHFYSRVPTLGLVWVRPNWGLAFIPADLSIDVAVHRQIGPMLNVNAYLDSTLAYGYAQQIKMKGKNKFYWGATLKALHRVYGGDTILASELVEDSDIFNPEDAAEGMTVDLDIGTLYQPHVSKKGFFSFLKYAKPQFAAVVRNVADYGFPINYHLIDEKSKEPPELQRRLDLGSKWDLPDFWVFDPHLAVDVRDIMHDNWTPLKGFHAGMELYWKMYSWWKGYWSVGINQGYPSVGFGARMAFFNLDIASWGEEVGVDDARTESRRYIVEMSLDF